MPSAEASGAMCVQRFDGSRNSAIHTTYRISLRSSSLREPRYPLLRVVLVRYSGQADCIDTLDWFCLVLMLTWTDSRPKLRARTLLQANAAGTPRF